MLLQVFASALFGQTADDLEKHCDEEQTRLDMIDGKLDMQIAFSTAAQNERGKRVFFQTVDRIQANLKSSSFPASERTTFYNSLISVMQGLRKQNVRYLSFFEQYFRMVESLSKYEGRQRDMELLKNNVSMALECIPFFIKRDYAKEVLLFSASKRPYDVLTKYVDYAYETWFLEVLETVAWNDPNAIKQYFGAQHTINMALKMSKNPVVLKLYDIYYDYGRASSGYTNIDLVYNGKMSIEESEKLVNNRTDWFKKLCELRRNPDIIGTYSVDQELTVLSLKSIRHINFLHDEKDVIRFSSVNQSNAEELYNLMVYSTDEIFTSSFLGLFKRMMERRKDSSMFAFFQRAGFNKFRTFIQMCAGFNTLQTVLNTMSAAETHTLIDMIVQNLEKTGGNLAPAVEVADIFGSIQDSVLRNEMADKLGDELRRCFIAGNSYGTRLYGLLYKLAGKEPTNITGAAVNFDIPLLDKVEKELMLPDKINVQQHVFFDDKDGESAYLGFVAQFRADKNYRVTDKVTYTMIETVIGNKVILYCNKPKSERGLEDLRKLFEKTDRYPDIVVHRGHSYHLSTTIDLLTNNTKIAVLGSCGGYLNISKVIDNASDAQIVSSKQVGTWTVNNVLLKDLSEMIRKGDGEVDWRVLWAELDKKLRTNDKWKDYIPPYRNLGVRFVRAFSLI